MSKKIYESCKSIHKDGVEEFLNILRNSSKNLRKFVLYVVEYMIQNSIGYDDIATIVHNTYFPPVLDFPDYIYGAVVISHLTETQIYNKNIYLVGEIHNRKYNCTYKNSSSESIADFLYKNLLSANKYVDVYVEYPYGILDDDGYEIKDSYLKDFIYKIKGCFSYNNRTCDIPQVRIHAADYRNIQETTKSSSNYLDIFRNFYHGWINRERDFYKKNIVGRNSKEILKKVLQGEVRLKKQLTLADKEYKGISQKIIYYCLASFNFRPLDHNNYKEKITDFMTAIMNIYLLTRIFRRFKYKKSRSSVNQNNIIIYTGSRHTYLYVNFLIAILGFKEKFLMTSERSACFNIKGMKLPFFNDGNRIKI